VQEKPKVRQGIDVVVDCVAPGAFYRVEEGGEKVSWRRNGWWRVSFSMLPFRGEDRMGQCQFQKG
jgi:hypothetical protein